jgi:hypothetical protein
MVFFSQNNSAYYTYLVLLNQRREVCFSCVYPL